VRTPPRSSPFGQEDEFRRLQLPVNDMMRAKILGLHCAGKAHGYRLSARIHCRTKAPCRPRLRAPRKSATYHLPARPDLRKTRSHPRIRTALIHRCSPKQHPLFFTDCGGHALLECGKPGRKRTFCSASSKGAVQLSNNASAHRDVSTLGQALVGVPNNKGTK